MKTLRPSCGGEEVKVQATGPRRCRIPLDHVMCEVLLRLPVKTLKKFQHVCMSWRALISDPYFRESHRKRFNQNPRLLVCTSHHPYDWEDDEYPLEPGLVRFSSYDNEGNRIDQFDKEFPLGFVRIISTCFDFVCLRDFGNVYLCNPATQQFITLPSPVIMTETEIRDWLVYAKYGFGYVSSTNEFKVLRILYTNHQDRDQPDDCVCEVFTLGTDRWRPVGVPPFEVRYSKTAFVNGAIYMVGNNATKRGLPHFVGNDIVGIATFDVDQEEWGMLPGPTFSNTYRTYRWQLCIRELNKYLCVTHSRKTHSNGDLMDFWLLKDYDKGGEWVKEFTIDLSPLYDDKLAKLVAPLTSEEEEEDVRGKLVDANQLVEYVVSLNINADDDTSKLVQPRLFLHHGPDLSIRFSAGLYYESILSLGSM